MELKINSRELTAALKIVKGFILNTCGQKRPILNMMNVELEKDKLYFYATDSIKAIRYELKTFEASELTNFIINPNYLIKLLELYDAEKYEDIIIYGDTDTKADFIDIGENKHIPLKKCVDAKYPDLKSAIDPQKQKVEDNNIIFNVHDLSSILKTLKKANCEQIKILNSNTNYQIVCGNKDELYVYICGTYWNQL